MKAKVLILLWIFNFQAAAKSFRLGVIYHHVGSKADFQCITNGVFSESVRKKYDIDIKYVNNENNLFTTIKAANQLVKKGVDLVIGTRTSQEAIAASKIFDANKIPFIAPIASHPDVTLNRPLSLGLTSDSFHHAKLMAKFAFENLKAKKVAVISNLSLPYSSFYAKEFPNSLKRLSPEIEIEYFEIINGFKNFKAITQKIINSKADLVYLPLYTMNAFNVFSSFVSEGSKIKMLAHASLNDGRKLFAGFSSNVHPELYFNSVWKYRVSGPEKKRYLKIRSTSCKEKSDNLRTISAYDTAMWVLETLSRSPKARGEELVKSLQESKYRGLLGPLVFRNGKRNSARPLQIFRVKNRGVKYFKEVGE